ncbi:MAG: hypothetical protein LBT83_03050 [Tannerella sp.]|nr:hypothetical protein [Tannerella sp.]
MEEILQKEEERHQLVKTGVITDFPKAMEQAGRFDGGLDKTAFLQYFYHSVAGYAGFIEREKTTNERLKKQLYRRAHVFLSALQKQETAPLDMELKTGSRLTLAYHLSESIYHAVYAAFCQSTQSFETPDEVDAFFFPALKTHYPLYIREYVERLEQDERSFWEVTCLYLQDLSGYVVRQTLSFYRGSHQDIIRDDTWSKSYEILRNRLVKKEGRLPVFLTGKDFRNYMIKVCRFLADNLYKKYAGKEVYMEEVFPYFQSDGETEGDEIGSPFVEEASPESPEKMEADVKELDIDTGNPYEVAYAVSIILLNTDHVLHQALVQGVEEKVALLIDKTVHGMSYNEIVARLYGGRLQGDDFQRAVVKARKDFERVRKTLTDRIIRLAGEKRYGRGLSHLNAPADGYEKNKQS